MDEPPPDNGALPNGANEWRLNRVVPLSFVAYLLGQLVLLIAFATDMRGRVIVLERDRLEHNATDGITHAGQNHRLDVLEGYIPKIAVIEARQADVIRHLEINSEKLDLIESKLDRMNPPIIPRR